MKSFTNIVRPAKYNKIMKNIQKIVTLIFLTFFFGCDGKNDNSKEKQLNQYTLNGIGSLEVVEIDHCEYFYKAFTHSIVFTHKGNCKFCKPIVIKKENDLGNKPLESVIGEQYEDALDPKPKVTKDNKKVKK